MCHLQDVCSESNEYVMSIPERLWRSFRIRCRILKLRIFYLKEGLRKILTFKNLSNKNKIDNSEEKSFPTLKPGDIVKVKPFYEIKSTLDKSGCHKGMLFIDEMVRFCGKTYKVFKRVNKVYMHRDKKMQKCRNVVLLEGVLCDGYGPDIDCDRTCFFFWKEAWLEKTE